MLKLELDENLLCFFSGNSKLNLLYKKNRETATALYEINIIWIV